MIDKQGEKSLNHFNVNLLLVAYEYKRLKPLAAWQNPFAK
jgi:hypothetical protein